MNKNNILGCLILFVSVLLAFPAAAYDIEVDGIYYNTIGTRRAYVTYADLGIGAAESYSGSIIIPEEITHNGRTYSVFSIGEGAFSGCDGVTEVHLPASVKAISACAFLGCQSLRKVEIKNPAATISSNAFACCTSLQELVLPGATEQLDTMTFYCCASLERLFLPYNVKAIKEGALTHCNALQDVYCFGEEVPEVEAGVFGPKGKQGTLHVPAVAIKAYKQSPAWGGFSSIVALTKVDYINIDRQTADINEDGRYTAADLVFLVNMLLSDQAAESEGKKPAKANRSHEIETVVRSILEEE